MAKNDRGRIWLEGSIKYSPHPWADARVGKGLIVDYEDRWNVPVGLLRWTPDFPASLAKAGIDTRMIEVKEGSSWYPDDFLDSHPRFWDDVRQLAFAFDEEDEDRVCRFCCEYGRLGRYPLPMLHESWAYLKDIFGWFQMLTCLTEAVKERRTGFLREFGHEHTDEDMDRGFRPGYFHTRHNDWEEYDSDLYYIRFPYEDSSSPHLSYVVPEDDARLLRGTWDAITETATIYLNSFHLIPLVKDFSNNRFPKVTWAFEAKGAVEAAFLQWFFTEFSQIQPNMCAADDCSNLVPADRSRWCSERCRERMKKRNAPKGNERGGAGE